MLDRQADKATEIDRQTDHQAARQSENDRGRRRKKNTKIIERERLMDRLTNRQINIWTGR